MDTYEVFTEYVNPWKYVVDRENPNMSLWKKNWKIMENIQMKCYWESLAEFAKTKNSLVWFYGISTTVGYIMPNPLYTFISNIQFVNIFCW